MSLRPSALPVAILLGVVVRTPFWAEALRTPLDGDTAIIGLMARHPGQGLTMWGQPYGSPLEAWLAAPLLAALGPSAGAVRLWYFLLGLALIPLAYALARVLDPRAALPAAILMACPSPYFILLSALPPPMYPMALLLGGVVLLISLRLGDRLREGPPPWAGLVAWGLVAGLALWTHLMSGSVVLAAGGYLVWQARGRRWMVLAALVPLLVASAPWWALALADRQATRVVSVSGRQETLGKHLGEVVPQMIRPLGGVLGAHVPLVADDPDHVVAASWPAAAAVALIYGTLLVLAVRAAGGKPAVLLLLATIALTVIVFPFPLRSGPSTIRFLTPLYLPLVVIAAWLVSSRGPDRRVWLVVLTLAALHLSLASRLLAAWRGADRAKAPFLLPDLDPVRKALESHGVRRAYASYGVAYRITFDTGERIVVSQPWNERFLHYPLPYLDEVRFAKSVAWVLTPGIPSDLPLPPSFEKQMATIGGTWRRTEAGPAVLYDAFVPPFGPAVKPWPGAGAAGDGDPLTSLSPSASEPTELRLPAAQALDAVTLLAPPTGPRLLRSFDVEVSTDGTNFEVVASRRRRGEREDLRWVNGHPQYVIDHDLLAVPLAGRSVMAVRLQPVLSGDAWGLAEVLLHPAEESRPQAWDEWLDPNLGWSERRAALAAHPTPGREDWHYRRMLAERR